MNIYNLLKKKEHENRFGETDMANIKPVLAVFRLPHVTKI